jgi:uncharacterized pyridoxal phosphate-dependent enzyme
MRRRTFFGTIGTAAAASQAGKAASDVGEDYYEKLGVTKIINAAGTYTALTASIMPPEVQAAVALAAKSPVRLGELQTAAGAYIAKKLQCEAAMVTAGAASALTLGTAACITFGNKCPIRAIPTEVRGLPKHEVLMQKGHRFGYDQAISSCNIKFVEVSTLEEYERAFSERTVMAMYYNAAEQGSIGREDWIRVARAHNVPCFNDAAADCPPIANLWNYTKMGFDLVTFSGGKGLRGPQNAGLLLGRKDLIAEAAKNNNPNSGIGRGMKVAKEQIVGMVAAVDWILSQTDEGMEKEFRKRADNIAAILKDLPSVKTEISVPPLANHVPHLLIRYSQDRVKITARNVMAELRKGTPSIELNPSTGQRSGASAGIVTDENTIVVGVWMLQPGEDEVVGKRLKEVLGKAATA